VAIVQISQITNRKGLSSDLPQLSGAELGWSTDTRQLWIGNGTLEEGAPVIGNTEILTQFSDILAFTNAYTYKGQAAGYTVQTGATPGTPSTLSLQSWLDQWASVLDFGAVGDGVTDDTAAINRALYQIYCREVNPQIRRSLFFPAGVYRVTDSINIPPYATLYGEGNDNSLIVMDVGVNTYVARTADDLQQTGVNIGDAGATPPQYINVMNMGFTHKNPTSSVFLVQDATNINFQNVGFRGVSTSTNLESDVNGSAGVIFASTNALISSNINFNNCVFSGLVRAVYANQQVKGITFTNSEFSTLYQGVNLNEYAEFVGSISGTTLTVTSLLGGKIQVGQLIQNTAFVPSGTSIVALGTGTGGVGTYTLSTSSSVLSETMKSSFDTSITGVRITKNIFDNIYAEGITIGDATLNASGYNIFYDVGNHFDGDGNPYTSVVNIQNNNNVSVGDMFSRNDADAAVVARIKLNGTQSIATNNGEAIVAGTYNRYSGQDFELVNGTTDVIFTVDSTIFKTFMIDYSVTRYTAYQTGTIMVAVGAGSNTLQFVDNNVQNASTGFNLTLTQIGTDVNFEYNDATPTGDNGFISYSIRSLT
jgi:Pectate lyase superfamily protein